MIYRLTCTLWSARVDDLPSKINNQYFPFADIRLFLSAAWPSMIAQVRERFTRRSRTRQEEPLVLHRRQWPALMPTLMLVVPWKQPLKVRRTTRTNRIETTSRANHPDFDPLSKARSRPDSRRMNDTRYHNNFPPLTADQIRDPAATLCDVFGSKVRMARFRVHPFFCWIKWISFSRSASRMDRTDIAGRRLARSRNASGRK
ncbi:hypothetical protein B0G73_114165 [Paraburkholderia sp. BL25I1N1]|nr:hypothetical protein B0G73_114165 [Paraburkholderia sp. BL25I1N1]